MRTLSMMFCILIPFQLLLAQSGQWTVQTSGATSFLYCAKAVDVNVGWISGTGGVVLRTINGGATWKNVGGGAIGTSIVETIDALNADTAFASTGPLGTHIYRTTNGGTSWSQVYSNDSGAFVSVIHMHNGLNGIAIGSPVGGRWTILKTTDSGISWSHTAGEPIATGWEFLRTNGATFIGETHAWFTAGTEKIYRSMDGGFTWTPILTSYAFSSIAFNDTPNGIAGVTSGIVGGSNNSGLSWADTSLPGTGSLYSVGGTTQSGFFASRGTEIYRSTNGGSLWSLSFGGGIGTITHMSFVQIGALATRGWAISSTGGIASVYFGPDLAVNELPIPGQIILYQNFPNPFNPQTTISFSISHSSFVTLEVFDLLGKEIATLVNEKMQPGEYERGFDGNGQASGVYLYRLHTRQTEDDRTGNSVLTRKLLLLR
jgi:photosystem II stability/assembly factor-like uncharacterized protein